MVGSDTTYWRFDPRPYPASLLNSPKSNQFSGKNIPPNGRLRGVDAD